MWRLAWTPILLLLSACMPGISSVTHDKHAGEVQKALNQPMPDVNKTGSLWAGSTSLFTDAKARRVGDLITVLVSEKASATRSLGTKKSKKSNRKTSLSAIFGYETSLSNKNPNFKPSSALDISDTKDFDGSGSTNNSDTLTASVTAVVTMLFPNGNMKVEGRRQVTINQQPQELTFSGIVRPMDIEPDNTIPSSKVAQAIISYGGGGELATVAHEGWFSRALDQIWPF
ncbi:MAG: flagellar basal body L-ring protein FlgH [Zetaproteobacteria bacterium]|nr:MAG: flagellar basal body L-ring protein FlgH [Zetaproteobacteria bacterium]